MVKKTGSEFFLIPGMDSEQFPFVYLPAYHAHLRSDKKDVWIVHDENYNSIACKIIKIKFITILQPMYPPLDRHGNRLNQAFEGEFLNGFLGFLRSEGNVDRIGQPENFAIFHSVPHNCTAASFGTYFLDLNNHTEEELFASIHAKHRNVIRNAEKKQGSVIFDSGVLNDFYHLYQLTTRRSQLYCEPRSFFENMLREMPENILCGVVYAEGSPQGGVFMPFTRFAAFYTHGASADKINLTGAMNFLHWEAIKYMKKKNVKRYDMVGARLSDVSGKLKGIQQFKERFGCQLDEGFLWKKDLHPIKCTVFDRMLDMKRKFTGQRVLLDIIDQESDQA